MQMFIRRILGVCSLLWFGVVLGGCAPLGRAPMIKSAVEPQLPLVPAAIYVPDCNHERPGGLLGFMGAADRALGEDICTMMWQAAVVRFAADTRRFAVLHLKVDSSDEKPGRFQPDLDAERAIGARYRVLLGRPTSYRHTESMGGGYGAPAMGTNSWVEAAAGFDIVDIAAGKTVGRVSLKPRGPALAAAESIMDRLARGLAGPRCPAYYFNSFSIKSAMQKVPKCDTFALPAAEPEDGEDGQ